MPYGTGVYGTEVYGSTGAGGPVNVSANGGLAAAGGGSATASAPSPTLPGSPISVRELPPLRLEYQITTPSGNKYRWGLDEPDPANVPNAARFSSTAPGGHENLEVSLARQPGVSYSDVEPLSTIQARSVGGSVAYEGRLERAPSVSGNQMAIAPQAVGWQAALDDNKQATFLGIDSNLSAWGEMPAVRLEAWRGAGYDVNAVTVQTLGGSSPTIEALATGPLDHPICERWYDAGAGNVIARVRATAERVGIAPADASTTAQVLYWPNAGDSGAVVASGNLRDTTAWDIATAGRFVNLRWFYNGIGGVSPTVYGFRWSAVRVFGSHGLTVYVDGDGDDGLLASDIVGAIVSEFAPELSFTTGVGGTIQPSAFVIPQFAYQTPTKASDMLTAATSFGLQDWFVWDGLTFYWHPRGARGRNWRARVGPSQLQETGRQVDRIWESIAVSYTDVEGSSRLVGPPGSGADTESADLQDSDPTNPATARGIIRRDVLQAGTLTPAAAIELGRRFLEETKALDRSGQAQVVGYIEDDHGVVHPYFDVRAGDTIEFVDARDPAPRRIIRADHDVPSATCTVDLDAPPDALDAILARLQVRFVPLGL